MGVQMNHSDIADRVKNRASHDATRLFPQPCENHAREKGRKMPPLKQHDGMTEGKKQ